MQLTKPRNQEAPTTIWLQVCEMAMCILDSGGAHEFGSVAPRGMQGTRVRLRHMRSRHATNWQPQVAKAHANNHTVAAQQNPSMKP